MTLSTFSLHEMSEPEGPGPRIELIQGTPGTVNQTAVDRSQPQS